MARHYYSVARKKRGGGEVLDFCEYCGVRNVISHAHCPTKCAACGTKYNSYKNLLCAYRKQPILTKRQEQTLGKYTVYYQDKKKKGYKVPKEFL